MKTRVLHWRKASYAILFTLLLSVVGVSNLYAQEDAEKANGRALKVQCTDGSETTIYWAPISNTLHTARICPPVISPVPGWSNYAKPTGEIILPETINYLGTTFTVIKISEKAFAGCSGLTGTMTIPSTVTEIGASAFQSCTGLTKVEFPDAVTSIAHHAFTDCTGLTGTLTLPAALTTLGQQAFIRCGNITGNLVIPNNVTTIENDVFQHCTGLSSVIIPNSMQSIGDRAFSYCSLSSFYSYATTPPSLGQNVFVGNTTSIPVYVPVCSISAYQNASGWTIFSNYKGGKFFLGNVNTNWSNENNWSCDALPESTEKIFIAADCDMDESVTVGANGSLTIFNTSTLSINPDCVLTVNGNLTNQGTANNLVINDGGQVKYNGTMLATLQKDILGFESTTRDNYYLIASPISGSLLATDVNGLITENTYDLYTFDQNGGDDNLEWRNYKVNNFTIDNTVGYLYANQAGTTIEFAGTTTNSGNDVTVNLDYTAGQYCAGYNLIGNPFTCLSYVDKDFQVLNAEGNDFVFPDNNGIMPGEAILVQAEGTGETAIFTTTPNPVGDSYIELNVVMNTPMNRGGLIDNARIRFGEGQGMDKFYLNSYGTRIYIPENGRDRALAYVANKEEIPVNFKAETNGTYTLNANLLNVESEYLHLVDNVTGNDIDLLTTSDYTFEAKTTDYASRFRLVFAPSMNNVNEDNFAFISNGTLIIDNTEEAILQVMDVTGRILSSEVVNGNYGKSLNLSQGVYVLRLLNGNDVKTQKIVVE